jgi:glutamate-1-semialdehyde 2,1-aminomutase
MEPVPCNYGLIIPMKGYLEEVRKLCDRFEVLLVFDEVITGFRLSRGGAQRYYNVVPDITTLGKIIGGGLPVGAYGASADIMSKVAPEGPVYQAGTLSGNPLAMAAGIATLGRLNSLNAWNLLKERARTFRDYLEPTLKKYAGRFLFTQLESIFSFTFTREGLITRLDDVKGFADFHREMLRRGIYLAPSGFEVGFLSTAHGDEELAKTAAAVAESLDEVL